MTCTKSRSSQQATIEVVDIAIAMKIYKFMPKYIKLANKISISIIKFSINADAQTGVL